MNDTQFFGNGEGFSSSIQEYKNKIKNVFETIKERI